MKNPIISNFLNNSVIGFRFEFMAHVRGCQEIMKNVKFLSFTVRQEKPAGIIPRRFRH